MQRAHSLCNLVIRDERLCLIHSNHCFPLGLHMYICMSERQRHTRAAKPKRFIALLAHT